MVLVADDVQRIIAEKTEKFASRKAVVGLVAVVGIQLVIVVALAASLGLASHSVARWNWLYGADRCATSECLRMAALVADSIDVDQDNTSGE